MPQLQNKLVFKTEEKTLTTKQTFRITKQIKYCQSHISTQYYTL